jgi:homeobox-leucine zipper protein
VNTVLVDGDTAQGRSLSTSSLALEVPVRQTADQEAAEDAEISGVGGGTRKKLRLSMEQSAFLEDIFKAHSTLSPVCVYPVAFTIFPCICGTYYVPYACKMSLTG